jgi:hypothetical protein
MPAMNNDIAAARNNICRKQSASIIGCIINETLDLCSQLIILLFVLIALLIIDRAIGKARQNRPHLHHGFRNLAQAIERDINDTL